MTTFNTLQELFEATNGHQLSVQQLINKRAHINGDYQNFEMTEDLSEEIIDKTLSVLGGQAVTQRNMRYALRFGTPQHWGLARIFVEKYGDSPIRFSYCAGQDYPAELQQIRKFLSK